jgi:hypothetical protein
MNNDIDPTLQKFMALASRTRDEMSSLLGATDPADPKDTYKRIGLNAALERHDMFCKIVQEANIDNSIEELQESANKMSDTMIKLRDDAMCAKTVAEGHILAHIQMEKIFQELFLHIITNMKDNDNDDLVPFVLK